MKEDSSTPSASIRAEAAVWVARLHSSNRSPALEAGFKRWLDSDPAHRRAIELATEAWELGGSVPPQRLPRLADRFHEQAPRRTSGRRAYLAAAAVLSAIVFGALLYWIQQTGVVTTTVGEQRMLTLEDGTRIFLNTDTRLIVHQERARRHVRLESGEALFDVTKDARRPFVVTAGEQEVVALGTSFVVRRDPRQLAVTLVEGRVAVSALPAAAPGQRSAILTPGQRLTISARAPPRLDQPPLDTVTAWRRGEVILDKTRLADAVQEMNRYSATKLVIGEARAAEILVSGIFRAGDSARFARAVGEAYGLRIEQAPQQIVISPAP